ncbi:MAG: alpha/beta fold hydrolase [Candidatus Helarchaeota archaeon]
MAFFDINGKKIEYLASYEDNPNPENPIILCIHGAGGTCQHWIPLLEPLANFCNAIAISLSGHGNSSSREPLSIESYVKDIDDVISLFPSPPILCGHSMGGAIVMTYALQNPNKIRGLILIGTGAKLKVSPVIFEFLNKNPSNYLASTANFMFSKDFRKNQKEKVEEFIKESAPLMKPETVMADFKSCNAFNVMTEIDRITLPTLILVGSSDFMTPPKYSTYLHEKIPNSTLEIINGPGHLVMYEKPEKIAEIIKKFVKKQN